MKNNLDKNLVQPKLRIELLAGQKSLGSFVTDSENKVIIGSAKLADFIVPVEGVSQIHAMVRVDSAKDILVYDLGSKSGTYINGKRVVEERLQDGDEFKIGNLALRVDIISAKESQSPEGALFWDASNGSEILQIALLQNQKLQEVFALQGSEKLICGAKSGEIFIEGMPDRAALISRKSKNAEVNLPAGFEAEIFDENNKIDRKESKNFKLSTSEKARLINDKGQEIQIYWRAKDARIHRGRTEQDNKRFQATLGISLSLSIAAILLLSFLQKPSEILEEATAPKSSYLRFTTQAAPAAASGGAESEKSDTPAAAPSKAAAITSMISQLVNKKSVSSGEQAVAVGAIGKQSIRTSNGEFSKQNIASNIGGGSGIDAKAMGSALAQAGSGGAKGLGGFGKGGVGVGTAAFGSVNGTGFSLNIGGDDAEAVGGLDKSLIAAVVQANIGQIKHCYERQLLVDSNLFGKVVAQWTIDKDGNVPQSSVKKSTLNSDPVEKCIIGKIRNWQFPKPKGGGQVFVSYPFLFKSTN